MGREISLKVPEGETRLDLLCPWQTRGIKRTACGLLRFILAGCPYGSGVRWDMWRAAHRGSSNRAIKMRLATRDRGTGNRARAGAGPRLGEARTRRHRKVDGMACPAHARLRLAAAPGGRWDLGWRGWPSPAGWGLVRGGKYWTVFSIWHLGLPAHRV